VVLGGAGPVTILAMATLLAAAALLSKNARPTAATSSAVDTDTEYETE
jgi:hypothetical protein